LGGQMPAADALVAVRTAVEKYAELNDHGIPAVHVASFVSISTAVATALR
jgi:hypothetical protein